MIGIAFLSRFFAVFAQDCEFPYARKEVYNDKPKANTKNKQITKITKIHKDTKFSKVSKGAKGAKDIKDTKDTKQEKGKGGAFLQGKKHESSYRKDQKGAKGYCR